MSGAGRPRFGRKVIERTEQPSVEHDSTGSAFPASPTPSASQQSNSDPAPQPPPAPIETSGATGDASQTVAELRKACLTRIDSVEAASLPPDRLFAQVSRLVAAVASEIKSPVNNKEQEYLARELFDDMTGLGPLQPLLNDDSITDIMVNGPKDIFIERRGMVSPANIRFRDSAHLVNICQKIASGIGRHVDEASPMVDARLADGSRVNIVLPPVALDGAAMSIRKFRKQAIDLEALVSFGSITPQIARLLEIIAHCRLNVIISGGTGSGKTTLLNAMSRHIDHNERIVTVEDAAELQLQQPHVVRLETRPASREGGNTEITARDLVKNALRMRPDRIIVGETRGAEAFDMLQAMNTGHDGSMSTVHANNVRDAIARIESMVQMSNAGLTIDVVRKQIVSAVNVIVQIQRQRDGKRRLIQLAEVSGMEGNVPSMNEIVQFVIDGETVEGNVRGHYKVMPVRSQFHERLVYFRLDRMWQDVLNEAVASA